MPTSKKDYIPKLTTGTLIKESLELVNTVATVWVWSDSSVGCLEDIILEKFVCTPDSWDVVSLELLSLYLHLILILSSLKKENFLWLEMHKNLQPETNYSVQFFIQCVSEEI